MRSLILSFLTSLLTSFFVLYLFLYHYVKVVDGVRVIRELEAPLLKSALEGGDAKELARRKALILEAFKLALKERRGIIFVSQGVFKAPFEDITDEVLERARYWYAYLLTSSGGFSPQTPQKQGREPQR